MKQRFDRLMQARRRVLRGLGGAALACGLAAAAPAVAHAGACAPAEQRASGDAPRPAAGKRIAMLVQLGGPNLKTDEMAKAHLASRGYAVRFVDEARPVEEAADADLVIVSSTVSSKRVARGWRSLAKPLLTWENDLLDDFAMTGKRHDVDFGETGKERHLWLVNAPHPIAAGLPAGTTNVYGRQAGMSWGKPGLGASIVATVYGEPDRAAIFAYEKGATMDYETLAPARRVMFFLTNDTFGNLSPEGVALFDAAVDWAAGLR
ncbi:hypothetical protein [Burkholderia oklahomensis]|uniref:Lipoprotein transmembrane n=2 Tax=Burkholderia oklahomensis TaxID=342113 RepID=A0AAI8FRK8_9BURK|nr:hypothetical protein [Burkholderia oklahomensis]AIO70831.1 putative lipoprotein transmembrane [Burkholderia oklahomensis]AJX34355.1 putative lipoprotein transmembrane [Burkholderia oklahomensis C6786]AOI39387.1 hypothetical protein WG70_06975 [Burkholderia oklahomensis EO147]AOI49065.1 hypothetical protein WI23_25030 [Burkholderia oklahomensis C6786]KUY53705.1 hypothetical protein WG70_13575 [Burkholderia oklahomensis EO147]